MSVKITNERRFVAFYTEDSLLPVLTQIITQRSTQSAKELDIFLHNMAKKVNHLEAIAEEVDLFDSKNIWKGKTYIHIIKHNGVYAMSMDIAYPGKKPANIDSEIASMTGRKQLLLKTHISFSRGTYLRDITDALCAAQFFNMSPDELFRQVETHKHLMKRPTQRQSIIIYMRKHKDRHVLSLQRTLHPRLGTPRPFSTEDTEWVKKVTKQLRMEITKSTHR